MIYLYLSVSSAFRPYINTTCHHTVLFAAVRWHTLWPSLLWTIISHCYMCLMCHVVFFLHARAIWPIINNPNLFSWTKQWWVQRLTGIPISPNVTNNLSDLSSHDGVTVCVCVWSSDGCVGKYCSTYSVIARTDTPHNHLSSAQIKLCYFVLETCLPLICCRQSFYRVRECRFQTKLRHIEPFSLIYSCIFLLSILPISTL